MNKTDEKIITALDIMVPREDVVGQLRDALERYCLYQANGGLMEKIDHAGLLLENIENDVNYFHSEAVEKYKSLECSHNFISNYEKLSIEGRDKYWSGDLDISGIDVICLPWREF